MVKASTNIIIYGPVLFSVVSIHMGLFHINSTGGFFPWNRPLSPFEELLERRGLLGDAAVGIMTHIVVYLSSETKVRASAKALYSLYLLQLRYIAPLSLLNIHDDELLDNEIIQRNANAVLMLAIINLIGAIILGMLHPEKVKNRFQSGYERTSTSPRNR